MQAGSLARLTWSSSLVTSPYRNKHGTGSRQAGSDSGSRHTKNSARIDSRSPMPSRPSYRSGCAVKAGRASRVARPWGVAPSYRSGCAVKAVRASHATTDGGSVRDRPDLLGTAPCYLGFHAHFATTLDKYGRAARSGTLANAMHRARSPWQDASAQTPGACESCQRGSHWHLQLSVFSPRRACA